MGVPPSHTHLYCWVKLLFLTPSPKASPQILKSAPFSVSFQEDLVWELTGLYVPTGEIGMLRKPNSFLPLAAGISTGSPLWSNLLSALCVSLSFTYYILTAQSLSVIPLISPLAREGQALTHSLHYYSVSEVKATNETMAWWENYFSLTFFKTLSFVK